MSDTSAINAATIGSVFIMAMAFIGSIGVLAHISGQLYKRWKWRRMERERQAALRSGVILTDKKGGGK